MANIEKFRADLDLLEEALGNRVGHRDIEMYLRLLKMELRCARTVADDEV